MPPSQWEPFCIPDALDFVESSDGLTRAIISTEAADAELYLQGAHLEWWTPGDERPILFLSSKSLFAPGQAIRGGIPIIFPWFGPRANGQPGPQHGFARTMVWSVEKTALRDDGAVEIVFVLLPNDTTRGFGYGGFELRYHLKVGATLEMKLETRNVSEAPLVFEQALHTYLSVSNIHDVSVTGLERTTFIDKTDGLRRKTTGPEPFRITKETDQVHVNTKSTCVVHDPGWNRRIVVAKEGSDSTVLWNPWKEKVEAMTDMPADGWTEMLCVETANAADNAVQLLPGASHRLSASISSMPIAVE